MISLNKYYFFPAQIKLCLIIRLFYLPTCGCWSSQATQGQVLRLIEEEAAHDRTTTDQPRREHLISGTTESPKREQISMWSVEAWQSHSKQCKMHGITGYPVGFQKVSHSKHCRMHGIKGNKLE